MCVCKRFEESSLKGEDVKLFWLKIKKEVVLINTKHGLNFTIIYEQLVHAQSPKAQKKTVNSFTFFALLGSAPVKAACEHVGEIDTRCTVQLQLDNVQLSRNG